MFGGAGIQEVLILMLVIGVLTATGLWPKIVQGIRDLRGDTMGGMSADDANLCYKVLGLSPSAPWPEIEKAYRAKARIHHPDRGGDEDAMRMLNDAYNILKKTRRNK